VKILPAQFSSFCQRDPSSLRSILFYGEEEFFIDQKLNVFIQNALKASLSSIKKVSEVSLLKEKVFLMDLLNTNSLFEDPAPLLIEDASDKLVPILKEFIEVIASDQLPVLIKSKYLGPKSKLRSLYESENQLAVMACYAPTLKDLMDLAGEIAKAHNKGIASDALSLLCHGLLSEPSALENEVLKIITYIGDSPLIQLEDVKACLSPYGASGLEEVSEAILSRNAIHLIKILDNHFSDQINAIALIRVVSSYFLRLHEVSSYLASGSPFEKACQMVAPPVLPFQQPKISQSLRNWPLGSLTKALKILWEAEKECKLSSSLSQELCTRAFFEILKLPRA
jgi:DNA polymerase-3 subunit delta